MQSIRGQKIVSVLTFLLICCIAFFWGFAPSASASEVKKIILVGEGDYPPFEFKNTEGEYVGIFVDTWNLWSQKTGIQVDYRHMEWDDALDAMKKGQADVIDGLSYSKERESYLDFAKQPINKADINVFYNDKILGLHDLKDLKGFKVGVVKGYSVEDTLKNYIPVSDIVSYADNESLVSAAKGGEINVFATETMVAIYYLLREDAYGDFKYIEEPIIADPNIPAVAKGRKDVLDAVNRGFSMMTADEIKAIEGKWTGTPLKQSIPWDYVILVGAVGIVLFGLMLLWNALLQRKVNAATKNLLVLNESLQESNRHLQRLDEAKTHFIAIASHELRTPLGTLKSFLSMFIDQNFWALTKKQDEAAKIMLRNCNSLLTLVNEMLDLTKIELGKADFQMEVCDIRNVLKEVYAEYSVYAKQKGINFRLEAPSGPIQVKTDPERLRKVLVNLVDNAVKFSESGASIRLVARAEGNHVHFEVRDTGVGIDPEDIQKIFTKFWKTAKYLEHTSGTGLGLSIAKEIVGKMGGQLDFTSTRGVGSSFYFSLPTA